MKIDEIYLVFDKTKNSLNIESFIEKEIKLSNEKEV